MLRIEAAAVEAVGVAAAASAVAAATAAEAATAAAASLIVLHWQNLMASFGRVRREMVLIVSNSSC